MGAITPILMNKALFILCWSATLICSDAFGQKAPSADYSISDPITEYTESYLKARDLMHSDPHNALPFARKSAQYAKRTKDSLRIAKASYVSGIVYCNLGMLEESISQYLRAIAAFKSVGESVYQYHSVWNIGYCLFKAGAYEESRDYLESVRDKLVGHLSDQDYCRYMQDLGNAYFKLGSYDIAKEHYENSLTRQINNPEKEAYSYLYLGMVAQATERFDRASILFQKGLRQAKKIGNNYLIGYLENRLGMVSWSQLKVRESIYYFEQAAMALDGLIGTEELAYIVSNNLAGAYYQEGQVIRSKVLLRDLVNSTPIQNNHVEEIRAYGLLTLIESTQGNVKEAENYRQSQLVSLNSLKESDEELKQMLVGSKMIELLRKPAVVLETTSSNWIWIMIACTLMLMLVSVRYLWKKTKSLRRELELKTSQLKAKKEAISRGSALAQELFD